MRSLATSSSRMAAPRFLCRAKQSAPRCQRCMENSSLLGTARGRMVPSLSVFSPRPRYCSSSSFFSPSPPNIAPLLDSSSGTTTTPGEGGGVSGKSPHTVVTGGDSSRTAADDNAASPAPPVAVFPWRHSPEPLPRLVPGTSDHELYGTFGRGFPKGGPTSRSGPTRFLFRAFAARLLGVSWFQYFILNRGWEDELASNFAWAFQRAVASLLAGTYRVPLDQIVDKSPDDADGGGGGGRVNFEHTLLSGSESDDIDALSKTGDGDAPVGGDGDGDSDSNSERTSTPPSAKGGNKESGEVGEDEKKTEEAEEEGEDEALAMATSMLDPNLVQLYESARDHAKGSVQILLRTRAVSWEIVSWYIVPVLTRGHVAENPNLGGSFRHLFEKNSKLLKERGRAAANESWNFGLKDLSVRAGADPTKTDMTLVAQVSVGCRETFVVRDDATGRVLQGDAEGRERDVTHLVRFEMPVVQPLRGKDGAVEPKFMALGNAELGSWQITDWDDLLDGNIWY